MAVVSMNLDVNGVADWLRMKYFVKNAFNEAPKSPKWRHDTQHNDIQHNDTQHNRLMCDAQHQ